MNDHISSLLTGIETRAWAAARVERDRDDDDEVAAMVAAEWTSVTLVDRLWAARGRHIAVTCADGLRVEGVCTRVGRDWFSVRHAVHEAMPLSHAAMFVGLPTALHDERHPLPTWTMTLRSMVGPLRIRTLAGWRRVEFIAVAQDHCTLDTGEVLTFGALLGIRLET